MKIQKLGARAWVVAVSDRNHPTNLHLKAFPDGIVYLIEFEDGSSEYIHEADILPIFLRADWNNIRECMVAILEGPYIDDREFETCLGFDRAKLRSVIATWSSAVTKSTELVVMNNCQNEVTCGIRFTDEDWKKWFTVYQNSITDTFKRWRSMNEHHLNKL